MNDKKLISIVTPVFNESENIDIYFRRMNTVLDKLNDKYEFEFIITDNCSDDNTFELIKQHALSDPRIRAFRFSRNFGYQKSILTGYCQARGVAAIEFDVDLQDPPELLPHILKIWSDGNKIVYGIRIKRQETFILTGLRKIFYRLLKKISDVNLPVDVGDFMLIDRCVLNKLTEIRDQSLYIRGIVFSMGFKRYGFPYLREARITGQSKFSFARMLSMALDGIVSQSIYPLRIATYLGCAVLLITLILSLFYVFLYLYSRSSLPQGFTTITMLILFSMSLNAIFLGFIGEYIGRIYLQIRNRPITIIAETVN